MWREGVSEVANILIQCILVRVTHREFKVQSLNKFFMNLLLYLLRSATYVTGWSPAIHSNSDKSQSISLKKTWSIKSSIIMKTVLLILWSLTACELAQRTHSPLGSSLLQCLTLCQRGLRVCGSDRLAGHQILSLMHFTQDRGLSGFLFSAGDDAERYPSTYAAHATWLQIVLNVIVHMAVCMFEAWRIISDTPSLCPSLLTVTDHELCGSVGGSGVCAGQGAVQGAQPSNPIWMYRRHRGAAARWLLAVLPLPRPLRQDGSSSVTRESGKIVKCCNSSASARALCKKAAWEFAYSHWCFLKKSPQ